MNGQRYQGYPYVNPIVIDAPSIDAATASRWANLPRRPLVPPSGSRGAGSSQNVPSTSNLNKKDDPEQNPVVYIDLPEDTGSVVSQHNSTPEDDPEFVQNIPSTRNGHSSSRKHDLDQNPVVYIDLPEDTGSVVTQQNSTQQDDPEFVQETILYDPFENRRIDCPKDDSRSVDSDASGSTSNNSVRYYVRPQPPNQLNLLQGSVSSRPSPSRPYLPSYMTKESFVYGGQSSNDLPISPISLSEFPEPPPGYAEATRNIPTEPSEVRVEVEPPRTQVIVTQPAGALDHSMLDRKYMTCHHCMKEVHTVVIKENGYITFMLACFLFVFCMPLLIFAFVTDWFKHTNHYCPNCNNLIGFVPPIFGKNVHIIVS